MFSKSYIHFCASNIFILFFKCVMDLWDTLHIFRLVKDAGMMHLDDFV